MAPKQKQVPADVEPAEQQPAAKLDPKALLRNLAELFVGCSATDADFDMNKASEVLTRTWA